MLFDRLLDNTVYPGGVIWDFELAFDVTGKDFRFSWGFVMQSSLSIKERMDEWRIFQELFVEFEDVRPTHGWMVDAAQKVGPKIVSILL